MIAVIDYGMGNLRSVSKALERLGAEVEIISSLDGLKRADKAVLPGVGAFKDTMDGLESRGLRDGVKDFIASGKLYLGICMGLQILFDESEEGGKIKGLGILKGKVKRFNPAQDLKVPHMGWNGVSYNKERRALPFLVKGVPDGSYFYFVHSYYVVPEDKACIAASTDYGVEFTSFVSKDNIYATQFHPEKSQDMGLTMLKNFIEL